MALRGVTAALVRQQGYLPAQTVTEIHVPADLAVGDAGAEEVVAGGDGEDYVFGSVHHRVDDADLIAS